MSAWMFNNEGTRAVYEPDENPQSDIYSISKLENGKWHALIQHDRFSPLGNETFGASLKTQKEAMLFIEAFARGDYEYKN